MTPEGESMTPGERSKQGVIFELMHPRAGTRICMHVFDTDDGIAWVESGWTDLQASGSLARLTRGVVVEEKWQDDLYIIDPDGEEIPLLATADQTPEGKRETAKATLERVYEIKISP
jgi:hypothetical protein